MKKEYAGLGEASEALGLSRTLVQRLVDSNELIAFKTVGGHRRILRASLETFQKKMKGGLKHQEPVVLRTQARHGLGKGLTVLVVDEDAEQAQLLAESLSSRNLEIKFTIVANWLEAALWLGRIRPYMIMMTVRANSLNISNGLSFIKTMTKHPDYQDMPQIVFSDMSFDELALHGCCSDNIVFFGLPVNFDRLEGFAVAHEQLLRPGSKNKLSEIVDHGVAPGLN